MKIVACYSNKGGVGKTAAAVNLAYAFAETGMRTLLCDLDPQGASGFYFRVKPSKKLTDEGFFKDEDRLVRSIRGSDYDHLDILPANLTFRDFDLFLSRLRNRRSRLHKALGAVRADYDIVLLDCPPNITALSESVFDAADAIVVPVIPTTLSQRAFVQLLDFFKAGKLPARKIFAFFSMVQGVKSLHGATIEDMAHAFGKRFLDTRIPFASDVERMGVHRAPVLASAPAGAAAIAYRALAGEVLVRLGRR